MRRLVLCLSLAALAPSATSQTPPRTGPFLGEAEPDEQPVLFAPGLVSTGLRERDGSLSPLGDCFAYTVEGATGAAVVLITREGDEWSEPQLAPFSGVHRDIEAAFDPAGGRLLFASQRPLEDETEAGDWNLWSVTYANTPSGIAWDEPVSLRGINGPGHEFYPSVSLTGQVVFTAERPGGQGGEDVWSATLTDGTWTVESLGPGVNTAGPEFNACIRPDGHAVVFSSVRAGDQGGGDLYVSDRGDDGSFGPARAAAPLNSPALDFCPTFSADGALLWFTSRRPFERRTGEPWPSFDAMRSTLTSAGNGEGDVYWVRASVLSTRDSSR